jgi:hypothetical protein
MAPDLGLQCWVLPEDNPRNSLHYRSLNVESQRQRVGYPIYSGVGSTT